MTAVAQGQHRIDPTQLETPEEFAAGLTELRQRAGLSIRQLARTTGIPSGTLGGYFSGRHLPPATQPQVLVEVLRALSLGDPADLDAWNEALLRVRRASSSRTADLSAPTDTSTASPYRGLEPFREPDAALFFGRESIVDSLAQAVDTRIEDRSRPNLLILVGASGSGKSSVLRAGLVPRLRADAQRSWTAVALVPGADPLAALDAARAEIADASPALLIVDQAEEVFSPEVPAEQRSAFIEQVALESAADRPDGRTVVVVAALRADFYGQAAADPVILPALQHSQLVLGSMTIDDLRRAIVKPAESVGVSVDPQLVDLLVRDLSPRGRRRSSYDAGALPLVSHALLATWARHRGRELTVADYVAAGGIAGAVQQTAEDVCSRLDDAGLAAAQWLFTQLVDVDDEGAMTRRRVSHDELHHPDQDADMALDAVIEAFVAGRLLTAGDGTLEVSHEALLTAWPRLHDWVLSDLDAARMQRRISDSAAIWRERDRDPAALLRGGPLADAQALAAQPRTTHRVLSAGDLEYVAASTALAEQEREVERHRTNRLRTLLAVMTALALVAGLLAGVAVWARQEAKDQQQVATAARDEALSRQLAIAANNLMAKDPALGGQLALAAYRAAPTLQARSALLASTGSPTPTRFVGPQGDMHATASPDGSVLAVSGADGVTRLWVRGDDGYEQAGQLSGAGYVDQAIYASAFSPDGDLLAIGTANGDVVLWNLSDLAAPVEVGTLAELPDAAVLSVAFSPDGTQLAAGTTEPSALRWAIVAGSDDVPTQLATITEGFGGSVQSVAYSADGDVLATGSHDGAARLWTTPTSGDPQLLGTAQVGDAVDFVHGVAFSPDGEMLATAEKAGVVKLWDVSTPRSPKQLGGPLGGFDSWVNSVAFSPDGTAVAAGGSDGRVLVFSVADGTAMTQLPNPSAVNAVQFVGSGATLLSSEIGGVARLWPLPGPVLGGFSDTIWSIAYDADEAQLAVAPGAGDGSLYLFDESRPGEPRLIDTLTPPASAGLADGAGAMSEDGRWVAVGTSDGNVVVWERGDGEAGYGLSGVLKASDLLIEAVAISPDATMVAGVADDGAVRVWSLTAGAPPEPLHEVDVPGIALGLAFSPDSQLLAVGTSSDQVHLWRMNGSDDGSVEELSTLTEFDNDVYGLAFDPSGQHLAVGSTDRSIRIWDMSDPASPVLVGEPIRGPGDTVYSLGWGEDGTLAAASKEGSVWLWQVSDPASPTLQATLPAATSLYVVRLADGGQRVLAGGSAQDVTTWQTDPEAVSGQMCAITGTPMTPAEWERVAPGAPYTPPCEVPAEP